MNGPETLGPAARRDAASEAARGERTLERERGERIGERRREEARKNENSSVRVCVFTEMRQHIDPDRAEPKEAREEEEEAK